MSRQRQLYKHSLKWLEGTEITQEHYERLSPSNRKKYRQQVRAYNLPELWNYSKQDLRSQRIQNEIEDYE